MKPAIFFILALVITSQANACPKPDEEGNISTSSVVAFRELVSKIDNPYESNKTVELCFDSLKRNLIWQHARIFLEALKNTPDSDYNDETWTLDRMVLSYMQANLTKLPPTGAIVISHSHPSAYECNKLIEAYFNANYSKMTDAIVTQILKALVATQRSDYFDETATANRILKYWQKKKP